MIPLKDRLLLTVKAKLSVHHDALVAQFGADAASAIHALYLANKVGIRNDGTVYLKF
jgi:hypothetical protein